MNETLELNLNGDTFAALKSDFNRVLKTTLRNMEEKRGHTAEVTLKLKIELEETQVPNHEIVAYEAMRDILIPAFTHKVSSVISIKDETTGMLFGHYELFFDRNAVEYVMRPIEDGQTSIYD
jgi:hypothetical protein